MTDSETAEINKLLEKSKLAPDEQLRLLKLTDGLIAEINDFLKELARKKKRH